QILSADAFDFAAKSSYSIRVRSTDETSLQFDKVFTITVVDDPALTRNGSTLNIGGTSGNDIFSFTPGAIRDSMTRNGVSAAAATATLSMIVFFGNGGNDTALLPAAATGSNTLVGTPTYAYVSGAGYLGEVVNCQIVTAFSQGGNDTAYLSASATGSNS